jgi:hypothetical protein
MSSRMAVAGHRKRSKRFECDIDVKPSGTTTRSSARRTIDLVMKPTMRNEPRAEREVCSFLCVILPVFPRFFA